MKTLRLRRLGAWAAEAGGSLVDLGVRAWPRPVPLSACFESGEIQVRDGLVLGDFAGSPTAIGRQSGTLLRAPLKPLLSLMQPAVLHRRLDGTLPALVAGIPAEVRAELAATAAAAGLDHEALMAANVTVDAYCSAVVRAPSDDFKVLTPNDGRRLNVGRPLRVARNMDFFPAEAIGPNTVITIMRPENRHAFVTVGWPGYAGVVSGMNVHGLVGCILLRHGSTPPDFSHEKDLAPPMACRVRQILETCANVPEAIEEFGKPVASGHYLLLADATTAAVVWHDHIFGVQVHHLDQGWLCCDNAPRDLLHGFGLGERAALLARLGKSCKPAPDAAATDPCDAAWMRRSLTAVYQNGINAQAMLFEPATRTLQVATGTAAHPAATGVWRSIDIGRALDGDGLDTVKIAKLPKSAALLHFTRGVF